MSRSYGLMVEALHRRSFLLFLLCALAFLPFTGKAFHIDDPTFLEMAKVMPWNPLQSTGAPSTLFTSTHAVVLPFILKAILALFGENGHAIHALFVIFPILALLSIDRFYHHGFAGPQRFAVPALLFLLGMPAFLVNAQNVMADVPSLACVLLGMNLYLQAVESRDQRKAVMAGVVFTVAVLITYQMLFVLPLVTLDALMRKRGWQSAVMVLVLPIVLIIGWLLLVYARYGVLPISPEQFTHFGPGIVDEVRRGLRADVLWGKAIFTLAMFGSSLLFVYVYRSILLNKFLPALRIVLVLSLGAYLLVYKKVTATPGQLVGLSLLLGTSLAILGEIIFTYDSPTPKGRVRARHLLFLAWTLTVLAYNIALMPFGSARYLLPALPAALVLLLDLPADLEISKIRRNGANGLIALALLFGITSAYSDYRFSDVYRDFSLEVAKFKDNRPDSMTTWYIGKWGMSYYLGREGARLLDRTSNAPRKGDFIIIPEMPRFWEPSPEVQKRMRFYASRTYRSPVPLRLFNRRSNAGFYAHHWGILPFAFSNEPDEVFLVYEVAS